MQFRIMNKRGAGEYSIRIMNKSVAGTCDIFAALYECHIRFVNAAVLCRDSGSVENSRVKVYSLKGQFHEIFCTRFFSSISSF